MGGEELKKVYRVRMNNKEVDKEITYIPLRYIIAMMLVVFEICAIIATVVALCYFVPYFYLLAYVTQIVCVMKLIVSDDNPDYKIPWLLFVLILPIAGFMLYLMFYSRVLKKKYVKRLVELNDKSYKKDDSETMARLCEENEVAGAQAKMLCNIAYTHVFENTKQEYYPSGELLFENMIKDLKTAERFILMEYFIIEDGKLWREILEVLKEKAKNGVEIKIVYDDIGCMKTLPGNYYKTLRKMGIDAVPFSYLKGNADNEINNRSHRKITVIDGKIGYTGGVNIADEYINEKKLFGHWKDVGIRLEGQSVWGLTKMVLIDYGINVKKLPSSSHDYFPESEVKGEAGYLIPFGDGPRPLYKRCVAKNAIQNMLDSATKYAYITTPYLIIDNELCQNIENAALRGVNVKIITPHVPDKRLIFEMTRSYYPRLIDAGVEIYEYEPGFIHAKTYLSDDEYAMVGTFNLDYRSLVHHFENGVWMYNCSAIADLKADFDNTLTKCIKIEKDTLKTGVFKRIFRSFVKIFAPLL